MATPRSASNPFGQQSSGGADLKQMLAQILQSAGGQEDRSFQGSGGSSFIGSAQSNNKDEKLNIWSALAKYGPEALNKVLPKGAPDTYVPTTRTGLVGGDISRGLAKGRSAMHAKLNPGKIGRSGLDAGIGVDRSAKRQSVGNTFGGISSIMDSMRNMVGSGGAMGGMSGGGSYIDDMLQQMLSGGGGQMPDMPDAEQMAKDQFAPQFDLLKNLRRQTTDRYNTAGSETRAVYDSLADQIRQEAQGTVKRYGESGDQMRDIGQNAISNVEDSASQSNAEIEAIMRRLGVQEAAPDALSNIAETKQRSVGSLAGSNAAFEQANEQLGQNMADYQQNTANTTGIAGANAQADWTKRLGEALAGYDNKELELTGAQKQAENEYMMQIQKMLGDYQSGMADNQMQALQMAIGRDDSMFDRQMAQNRFGLDQMIAGSTQENQRAQREMDLAKFQADQRAAAMEAIQPQKTDWGSNTAGEVAYAANEIFGGHKANAQSGMTEVRKAMSAPGVNSLGGLLRALREMHANSPYLPQYEALAEVYWNANKK